MLTTHVYKCFVLHHETTGRQSFKPYLSIDWTHIGYFNSYMSYESLAERHVLSLSKNSARQFLPNAKWFENQFHTCEKRSTITTFLFHTSISKNGWLFQSPGKVHSVAIPLSNTHWIYSFWDHTSVYDDGMGLIWLIKPNFVGDTVYPCCWLDPSCLLSKYLWNHLL